MQIFLDKKISDNYYNPSQKIRVISENWVKNEIFCPSCGQYLNYYERNKPVADFFCKKCKEDYELKSKKKSIGNKIVDGAYKTMLKRLEGPNNPNLFLLNYSINYEILNFFVIPKQFFIPEIIEKRNPLSQSARRAYWVGCNISLKSIPMAGKIYYIKDKLIEPKNKILETWRKTLFLREDKFITKKGWIFDIMTCIDKLEKKEFTLDEIYSFEFMLKTKYPHNKHIRDKIRQQLQILRDRGYLDFISRGKYRLT